MVIVWRLRGNIIRTVLYIANMLPLQWAQLTKTDHTARLGLDFVFLCFFRLHDLSLCWCMFCFTLDSWVIAIHVVALAWQTWMSPLRAFCSLLIAVGWELAPSLLGPLWAGSSVRRGACLCRWSSAAEWGMCRTPGVFLFPTTQTATIKGTI